MMTTMPEPVPGTLAEALAALQGQLPRVAKDQTASVTSQRTGKTHTYRYADLLDVSEALFPVMTSLGLAFTAMPTIETEGGRFVLDYALWHISGDHIGGQYPLPGSGSPQEIGTAITYARRYALCAVTGLAPGGDDDDAASAEAAHHAAARDDTLYQKSQSGPGLPGATALRGAQPPARQLPRTGTSAGLRDQGRMDRQQKAGHERLAADTVRDPKRADRSHPRGPDPDDPWAQDAPVDHERAAQLRGAALTDPEDKLGSRLESQHKVIERLLGQLHVESRVDRHNYVATLLGLAEVASFNHLTYNQAADAIRLLQAELAKEKADA